MKMYLHLIMLFCVVGDVCAMELISLSKKEDKKALSGEDAKALRLAKLFNKYPDGYGEDDQFRQEYKKRKECFFKSESYKELSRRVNWYQNKLWYQDQLTDAEAQELLSHMSVLEDDTKRLIFVTALEDKFQDYYATEKVIQLMSYFSGDQYEAISSNRELCKKVFLSEINGDHRYVFVGWGAGVYDNGGNAVSRDNIEQEINRLYPHAAVGLDMLFNIKDTQTDKCMLASLTYIIGKDIAYKIALMINADEKEHRVKNFRGLFNEWINNVFQIHDSKMLQKRLILLYAELCGTNHVVYTEARFKERASEFCNMIPLPEILSSDQVDYDTVFYNQLASSNTKDQPFIEFTPQLLEQYWKLPEQYRKRLQNYSIEIKSASSTCLDHIIFYAPLLLNTLMPEIVMYCVQGTSLTGKLLVFGGGMGINYIVGEYVFPKLRLKYDSHVALVKACINDKRIKKDRYGGSYFVGSFLQVLLSLTGNKLLSCQSSLIKFGGSCAHAMRALVCAVIGLY
jgi:hypothetical protein